MSTAQQFFNNVEKYIPKLGVLRLKDLIKQIRACKTAADERAVIAKESAFIRTSFKEENVETRHINVAKLLYIHMLGYPAHFGQMECLKLVASPKFADKRLGYLGIMLLLDENQEVLTLVTNCLKNDMNNSNMYVVGLALCTLGNISSQEMARDLSMEVEKLLGSSNTYVRKKAALCALRIVKKVPDLMENFLSRGKNLLNERNHGVLLTGVTLLTEMCQLDPEILSELRKNAVGTLVRHLKNLVTAGFSPEHDVSGVTDPFLQVKVLRLMRILGKGDSEASDAMNDVLAQVATNTEASKNVGNAILYETVLTIMEIESENSLRVLGINILGRFLANRDNNIRYVALTTLTKTCQNNPTSDSSALQRHRSTILDCLRDPDVSIRRRALDLSFFLINAQNIRILTRELLSFLEIAEGEVKNSVAVRVCDFAGRYRPNKRWEVDTVCRVLRVAGAYVDQSVVNHFVKLVTTSPPELQQYAVRKIYNIVKNEGERALTQEGLLQAMVWCVGEYGDVLVSGGGSTEQGIFGEKDEGEEAGADPLQGEYQVAPAEGDVVAMFTELLRGPYATLAVKEYSVTALAKLTGRFRDGSVIEQLRALIAKYQVNINVELQQRAVEYARIMGLDGETRAALLERMPVLESALKEESKKGSGVPVAENAPAAAAPSGGAELLGGLNDDLMGLGIGESGAAAGAGGGDIYNMVFGGSGTAGGGGTAKNDNIMDLLGGIGLGSAPVTSTPTSASSASKPTTDLLGDLFGGGAPAAAASPVSAPPISVDPLGDLLGGFGGAPQQQEQQGRSYQCYDKNGLRIALVPTKEGTSLRINAKLENVGMVGVGGVAFQVAVPKTQSISWLQALTSTDIGPGGSATQIMRIDNPKKAPIRLRLKVAYSVGGQGVDEIVEFSGFDPSLWA